MKQLHPEYDPIGKVWFTENVTAKTIRELLDQFPKGTTVKDYYIGTTPWGIIRTSEWQKPKTSFRPDITRHSPSTLPHTPKTKPKPHVVKTEPEPEPERQPQKFSKTYSPTVRDERILQLWADGYSARQVAQIVGDVSRNAVCGVIFRARERGDKRAR